MHSKKHKLISLGMVTSFVLGAFLFSGVTFGAFLNKLIFKNNITNNVGEAQGKFASGTGTLLDPYVITTPDHLRNLQKLTMLDIFNSNHHFALGGPIDWSSETEALLPIGTEDHPFNGQFDGRANIVKNLVVDGKDTNDIGMFGYTSINSRIKNIVLDHPTINVLTNTTTNGDLESTNVLNCKEVNDQAALLDLKATGTTDSHNVTTYDTIHLPAENEITFNNQRLKIKYISSDPSVLDIVDGTKTYAINKFPDPAKTHLGFYTLQISAEIECVDTDLLKTYKYTLERWNIELKISTDEKNNKTIQINTRTEGNNTVPNIYKNLHATNIGEHGINVGFFIGHCDGGASHLGVYGGSNNNANTNGIININGRKAKSTSSLIGRERIDNPYDNTAKNRFNKLFDFATYPGYGNGITTATKSKLDTLPMVDISTKPAKKIKESPESATNQKMSEIIVEQTQRSRNFTNNLLAENDLDKANRSSEYVRYYPKDVVGDLEGKTSIVSRKVGQELTRNVLRVTDGLRTGAYITSIEDNSISQLFSHVAKTKKYGKDSTFYLENGLWIYATKVLNDSFLNALFSRPEGFDAELKIKYIVNAAKGKENTSCKNSFVIHKNTFQPGRNGEWLGQTRLHSDVGSIFWEEVTPHQVPGEPPVEILLKTDKEKYGHILERTINFEAASKQSSADKISPMFGIGIGKGKVDKNGKAIINQKTNSDEINPNTGIPEYEEYGGGLFSGDFGHRSGNEYNDQDKVYYPVYNKRLYYERKETWDPNCESVDILDFDISFKTKDGNTSNLTNNVDFLSVNTGFTYTGPTDTAPAKVDGWEKNSNTKIYFDLNDPSLKARNHYYRAGGSWGGATYVYLYYNGPNSYVPANTPKFNRATINKDANIAL